MAVFYVTISASESGGSDGLGRLLIRFKYVNKRGFLSWGHKQTNGKIVLARKYWRVRWALDC